MNYEEKYKQALERARIGLRDCNLLDCDDTTRKTAITIIHKLFPELKESEDERIRKELIEFLKLPHSQFVGKRDHEKWITWLEKQGKKLNTNEVVEWMKTHGNLMPVVTIKINDVIAKFKHDFGL